MGILVAICNDFGGWRIADGLAFDLGSEEATNLTARS
jgi:hypothetical protein